MTLSNERPISDHCKAALLEARRELLLAAYNAGLKAVNAGHDAGDEDPQAWAEPGDNQ